MSIDQSAETSSGTPNKPAQSAATTASPVVPVRIAGHEYKIRSSGDPHQLKQIAGYVDRAMNRVRERTGTVDTLDVAVLTCLNLGREILALRERGEAQAAGEAVDTGQLRSLIERVEAVVGGKGMAPTEPAADEGADRADENESQLARTLELPSVEALRERGGSGETGNASSEDADGGVSESRVAAGGRRDRAS